MKTTTLVLLLLCGLEVIAQTITINDITPVSSKPVSLVPTGNLTLSVPGIPPEGWRVKEIILVLEPVGRFVPELELKTLKPSETNSVIVPKLELQPTPPLERKNLKSLSLGKEPTVRFKDDRPALFRISFGLGK